MKRITSLILVTLLVVSLFTFVGCSNTDEMQQKIEDLQRVLQTQTEILTELQNTNASNIAQIANLQTALQEQAKQIEDIQKEIEELSKQNGESRMEELLKHFDLTDPKEYWSGTLEELKNYCPDDRIVVVLRRTETYPIITPEDLPFGNIASIGPYPYYPGYEMSPTPEWVKEWEERYGREYRVVLEVELKEKGHENVYQALLDFQSLDFVKTVYPPKLLAPPYDPIYPENNRDKEV